MKKVLLTVLILCLLFSITAMADGFNPAANTFPASDEPVRLTVMMLGARPEVIDWDTNYVTRYWEDKMGIDIVWDIVPSATMNEKLAVTMAGEKLPDVIIGGGISKDMAVSYGAQGLLLPLNDLIDEWGVNVHYFWDYEPIAKRSMYAPDGNIYFLTGYANAEYSHNSMPAKMLINTRWLENVGMDMPSTPEELYEVLKAFKEQDANGNGDPNDEIPLSGAAGRIGAYIMEAFTYQPFVDVAKDYYYQEDGEVMACFTQEGWREGMAYLARLYEEELLDKECFLNTSASLKMLTGAEGGNRIGAAEMYAHSAIVDLSLVDVCREFSFIEPLKNADGERVTAGNQANIRPAFFLTKDCSNPEVAFRWGDAMLENPFESEDLHGLNAWWGPEGEGWRRATEGEYGLDGVTPAVYKRIFAWGEPNNFNLHESLLRFAGREMTLLQVTDIQEEVVNGKYNQTPVYTSATQNLYRPYAVYKSLPTMLMFTEDEVATASQLAATINSYVNESFTKFVTGVWSTETDWDSYLAELEQMKLSALLEMYQTAYARQFGE